MTRTRIQARAAEQSMRTTAIDPPQTMPIEARPIWDEITSAVGPSHFCQSDAGFLAAYCVALRSLRMLEREMLDDPCDGGIRRNYVAIGSMVTSMAGKLRLAPSTRSPRKDDRGYDPAEKEESAGDFLGGG